MKSATRSASSPFFIPEETGAVRPIGGMAKRSFDVLAASVALLLFSPLFLLIMALVKFSDGGSVFMGIAESVTMANPSSA